MSSYITFLHSSKQKPNFGRLFSLPEEAVWIMQINNRIRFCVYETAVRLFELPVTGSVARQPRPRPNKARPFRKIPQVDVTALDDAMLVFTQTTLCCLFQSVSFSLRYLSLSLLHKDMYDGTCSS